MLQRMLSRWRFERLRALLLEGSLGFAFWLAACLLAACLADAAFSLPQAVRYGVFLGGAAAFLYGFYRFLLGPLARVEPFGLLRAAGRRHPSVREYLRPAWELLSSGTGPNVSAELAEEHIRRTERLLARLPSAPVFPLRAPRGSLKRLGAVAVFWGLGLPWLKDGASLHRVLSPWRDVRLEALLEVRPGNSRVPWGSPVDISASWRAARFEPPALWLRSEGAWQKADWDSEGAKPSYRVGALTSPLEYQLRHKDLRSEVYLLTPAPFAHLTQLAAKVQLPGRRPPLELKLEAGGEIAALRGSWVTLSGLPDRAVESASLWPSFMSVPIRMKPGPGGRWEAGFPLNENGSLKLDVLSAEGLRDPSPVPFPLKALDDRPPSVELLSPSFELEISPRERLPVTYDARDDYGLSAISLVYRAANNPETRVPLRRLQGDPLESLGDYLWDLSRLPPGALVEFRVEAFDNASPKPQAGASRKGVLRLVDFETAHAKTLSQWKLAQSALQSLSEREKDAARRLRAMGDAPPEAREALQREWEAAEARLMREWESSTQSLDQLAAAMREDAYANPGMSEAAQAAAAAMKALKAGDLSRARHSARTGDLPAAAKEHDKLAAKVQRTAEMLKEGAETQALQDLWAEAHRMDQAGSEISQALGKLSAGGKAPSEAEKRRLDEALSNLRRQMESLDKTIASMPKADPGSMRDKNRKVFVVPLNSARRTMDALSAALARGDYEAAAKIAKRLSEELAQVRAALSEAAKAQAGGGEDAFSKKMEGILEMWKDAAQGQARCLQMTQGIEERRMQNLRGLQEDLLKKLAALQAAVVRESAELGNPVPSDAMAWMQKTLKEFEKGQVEEAPKLLGLAAMRLRAQAAAILKPAPDAPPPSVEKLGALAVREDEIRSMLQEGVKAPQADEGDLSERMAGAAVQGQVRRKTESLEESLEALEREGAALPSEALGALSQAQPEQRAGEGKLNSADIPGARKHQERALELLEQGMKSLSEAMQQQQRIEQQCLSPFGKPRGTARPMSGGGRTGSDTSFVPLPRSEDYQPPREIREEIERSLRERRPEPFDEIIREYLKKMSQ